MSKLIETGSKAKAFTLKDQDDRECRLSDLTGKKVLLSFHPLAWTSVCAEQMKSLEANKEAFDRLNTVALGLSVDTVPSKNAWAKELGIHNTRLLSDFWPHGKIAKAYGIFREANGFSERANLILDEKQRVVFVKVYPIRELPDIAEILKALA
ncbi:MAG TPA: redoxin domain-containing protein [Syntrophorhabdaceae bacterium]|nr:redoxin domain-containing protein [Syntrophorhabdaceae bacterium]